MATDRKHDYSSNSGYVTKIDLDCMVKDILKQWWVIILTAAAAALLAGAVVQMSYEAEYTATTTFVIGKAGLSYDSIYDNLNQAATTTKQYSQVVGSSILQKQVCQELGMNEFDAKINVETVTSSNLMVLRVTANSPRQAYLISRSVINQAVDLMSYFMENVTMQELESAVIPERPSNSMQMTGYMQRATLTGAVIMIVLIAFLSYSKDTIKNVDDISKKVDTKLLGTIDYEKSKKVLMSKSARKKTSLLINNPMLSFEYVESCRMLSTRVRLYMDRLNAKVLMVTSVSENEGKSTVAANIAVAMAQEGKRVLLADCDFRKPAQYKIFEVNNLKDKDFCDAIRLRSDVKIGHVKNMPTLYTLFSEKNRSNSWDEESFQYINGIFKYLREKVDYIILDTSPMALVSDTEEYAGLADASLLVIRQDVMEACYINDAVDNLEGSGTKLIGCVFNGVHRGFIEKTKDYGNYKGNYYSHYEKSEKSGRN